MTNGVIILLLGFVLGMKHATDADHVLAVSTIVSRFRRVQDAARIGMWWGVGHTITILIVGGGIVLFGWVIPPRLGLSMEFAVALMLILLGATSIFAVLRRSDLRAISGTQPGHVHSHAHAHGDYIHTHAHGHGPDVHPHEADDTPLSRLDRRCGRLGLYQSLRPLVVGMVHGLAGSAAVALLVLTTIRSPAGSMIYLALFGAGTILGMMLITAAIAVPVSRTGAPISRLNRTVRIAAGVASLVFGFVLAYQVGVVDGLFHVAGPAPR
jgi:high-affinity nickel-transport protein